MGKINEILALAKARATDANLPYAGALTPQEAWELLQLIPEARLVDVRTSAEWNWVGRVANSVEIEWMQWPANQPNPNFLAQLTQQVDKEAVVMFLCRSGVRSKKAATVATEAGYTSAYDVLEGFEGDLDANKHRNRIGGWRFAGLPWVQS